MSNDIQIPNISTLAFILFVFVVGLLAGLVGGIGAYPYYDYDVEHDTIEIAVIRSVGWEGDKITHRMFIRDSNGELYKLGYGYSLKNVVVGDKFKVKLEVYDLPEEYRFESVRDSSFESKRYSYKSNKKIVEMVRVEEK